MPEDRGVGKKVGSWESEKVRLNQDRGQGTEGERLGRWEGEIKPGQKTEDRGQMSEDRGQRTEVRWQRTDKRIRESEVGMRNFRF